MALRGSLVEFDLAGVFQLIQTNQHSGVLRVKGIGQKGWFSFVQGQLVLAGSADQTLKHLLYKYLVAKNPTQSRDYQKFFDKEAKKKTFEIAQKILENEFMNREELQEVVHQGLLDLACHIFTWKNGTYEFVFQDTSEEGLLNLALSPDMLCMEAMRRLDHFVDLQKTFKPDAIWLKNPKLLKNRNLEQESHSPLEFPAVHILVLLDGSRTLHEALSESFMSGFRFYDIMSKLYERKIILPLGEIDFVDETPRNVLVQPNSKSWMIAFGIGILLISGFFVSGILTQ